MSHSDMDVKNEICVCLKCRIRFDTDTKQIFGGLVNYAIYMAHSSFFMHIVFRWVKTLNLENCLSTMASTLVDPTPLLPRQTSLL